MNLKDLNKTGGGRKDLVYLKRRERDVVMKAFDYFGNVLVDSRTRLEFSHVFLDAQREADYFYSAVYDIDSVVFDYAENDIKAFIEFKTKEEINYLQDAMLYSKRQFEFALLVAELTKKPYLWLIRAGNGQRWWYLTDVTVIPDEELQVYHYNNKELVALPKKYMLTLTDEQLKDWIIEHIL